MTDPELGARSVMGLIMIILAALGAAIVAHASDEPMMVFGYALLMFGVAYVFGLTAQHFNAVDRANAEKVEE